MRTVTIATLCGIAGGLLCTALAMNFHRMRVYQITAKCNYECPMHLADLSGILLALANEADRSPHDLTAVTQKVPVSEYNARWRLHPALCPGAYGTIDPRKPDPHRLGYVYVDWSSNGFAHVTNVPADYPLAYDQSFSNHAGKGVFVVKVNGNVIWDQSGEWIRVFIKKHPEYHLSTPE